MFWEISGDVYRWVRNSTKVTQKVICAAIGRDRHAAARWEHGEALPTREQEQTLFKLARCPNLLFAEFVCKKLTLYTGRATVILPEGEIRGMPTTPLAEAQVLLSEHYGKLPSELRQELLLRIERVQNLQYVAQQETFALQREIKAILNALGVLKEADGQTSRPNEEEPVEKSQ